MIFTICPKCNSANTATERRPDGDSICQDCHYTWPNTFIKLKTTVITEPDMKLPYLESKGFVYSLCAGGYINETKNIRKYDEDKYYRWYTDGRIVEEKDHNQGYEFENGPVTTGTITATEVELRWQIKTLEWEIYRLKKENEILLETLQEELKKCK